MQFSLTEGWQIADCFGLCITSGNNFRRASDGQAFIERVLLALSISGCNIRFTDSIDRPQKLESSLEAYSIYLSPKFRLLRSSCASLACCGVSYSAKASPVDLSAKCYNINVKSLSKPSVSWFLYSGKKRLHTHLRQVFSGESKKRFPLLRSFS